MPAPATLCERSGLCGDSQNSDHTLSLVEGWRIWPFASAGGELLFLGFQGPALRSCSRRSRCRLDSIGLSVAAWTVPDGVGQVPVSLLHWKLGGSGIRPMALEPLPWEPSWLDAAPCGKPMDCSWRSPLVVFRCASGDWSQSVNGALTPLSSGSVQP